MTYSYTQIAEYLACPRRYRYRYLDGWEEKELRATMLFGRAFEKALAAHFLDLDAAVTLRQEWTGCRETGLEYSKGDSWEQMLRQGYQLLERFAGDDRVWVVEPERNLQVKVLRRLSGDNDFLGFVDAIGTLDGTSCILDWKTTSSCYATDPADLVRLDPQLVCYSWLTGIEDVAFVVFVRKKLPEIQYLKARVTEAQRQEFDLLVQHAVQQIESARFFPHSGIRFPQNQCVNCAFAGLCLESKELADMKLIRKKGADVGWLYELAY